MQRDVDQDGGVLEHPINAVALPVVSDVMQEERVLGVAPESLLRVFRRHRPRLGAVAGQTGAPVAAERLAVEPARGPNVKLTAS